MDKEPNKQKTHKVNVQDLTDVLIPYLIARIQSGEASHSEITNATRLVEKSGVLVALSDGEKEVLKPVLDGIDDDEIIIEFGA